jgi:mannose-6-phosphate isomerase
VEVGASDGESRAVSVGEAAFATVEERTLRLSGTGEAFIATPGA